MGLLRIDTLATTGRVEFADEAEGHAWSLTAVGDTSPYAALADLLTSGEDPFGDVGSLLSADLRYANWEGAIGPPPADDRLCVFHPPEAAEKTLEALGFNVFCVANNHTTDLGDDGLAETIRRLTDRGLVHGAGRDLASARRR